ncbi:hypothetical protein [Shewanella woodyi]|uniref:Uncharacterized protein n=1 Tax=Shewanella woodyi (strain ATCC 51908 / MS32) TaxID=392500 RepID=B1KPE0_SHEWM|nr:hypothetical protein [Shewanella woodyi]ACA84710.1 hypothetical protein Swoo_0411 [Shewanella woodyi ATCC 51908]
MEFIKTISDTFQSLAQNFNDRIKSPIGGAFFFSWIIFNWKLVYYILMQTESPSKKIAYVETHFLDIWPLLISPALASIAYVIFYPVIYNGSNLIWTFIDKNLKTKVAVAIEKKVLLTTEDSQQLYNLIREQKTRHEEEVKKLRGQIEALSKITPSPQQIEPSFIETVDTHLKPTDNAVGRHNKQTELPINQHDYDAEIKAKLTTEKGKKGLTALIMEMIDTNANSSANSANLSMYHLIIRTIFKSEPNGLSTQEIVQRVKNIDYVDVETLISDLENYKMVVMDTNTREYTLTNRTINKIYSMLDQF